MDDTCAQRRAAMLDRSAPPTVGEPSAGPGQAPASGSDQDLADWVASLNGWLERGDLAGLRRLSLDNGTTVVGVELAARALIVELAELDALPLARRERGYARVRRRRVIDTLWCLRRALESAQG